MKVLSVLFGLFSVTNAFKNGFLPFNNIVHTDRIVENTDNIQNNINEHCKFFDYLSENKVVGKFVVNSISSMLPKVDSIGHNVLHANNLFIKDVLNIEYLPESVKKDIVLGSIKLAIHGDNFGSTLLDFYYKIVDSCL